MTDKDSVIIDIKKPVTSDELNPSPESHPVTESSPSILPEASQNHMSPGISRKRRISRSEHPSPRTWLYDIMDQLHQCNDQFNIGSLERPIVNRGLEMESYSGERHSSERLSRDSSVEYEVVNPDLRSIQHQLEEETRRHLKMSTPKYKQLVQEPLRKLRDESDYRQRQADRWISFFRILNIVISLFVIISGVVIGILEQYNPGGTSSNSSFSSQSPSITSKNTDTSRPNLVIIGLAFTISAVKAFSDLMKFESRAISLKNSWILFSRIKNKIQEFYNDPPRDPGHFRLIMNGIQDDYERATVKFSTSFGQSDSHGGYVNEIDSPSLNETRSNVETV